MNCFPLELEYKLQRNSKSTSSLANDLQHHDYAEQDRSSSSRDFWEYFDICCLEHWFRENNAKLLDMGIRTNYLFLTQPTFSAMLKMISGIWILMLHLWDGIGDWYISLRFAKQNLHILIFVIVAILAFLIFYVSITII